MIFLNNFVGYAGFYGLSLIVGSYALLFVSMAAHAAQFAFLAFFENPRTSTPFTRSHSQFRLLTGPLPILADIERLYGERKLLAERKPLPLSGVQSLQRAAAIQRHRSFSATSASSAAISEETAIEPDGPVFDVPGFDRMSNSTSTGGMGTRSGADTPTRTAKITKHDLLNQYFRKDVVVWSNLDWFRCVLLSK